MASNYSYYYYFKRPDLVVVIDKRVIVLELTVCFDTNTIKSRDYKKTRYTNLRDELVISCDIFEVIYLEVTCLGLISKDSYVQFCKFLEELELDIDRNHRHETAVILLMRSKLF